MFSDFCQYAAKAKITVGVTTDDLFLDFRQPLFQEMVLLLFFPEDDLQGIGFAFGLIDRYFGENNVVAELMVLKNRNVIFPDKRNPFRFDRFIDYETGVVYDSHTGDLFVFGE